MNLVIAVITSSFQVTRDEMQQSAFVSKRQQYFPSAFLNLIGSEQLQDDGAGPKDDRPVSWAQRLYDQTDIFWVALIVVDLTVQAFRTANMSNTTARLLSTPKLLHG